MSIGHRITGTGLATLIYGFGLYYAMIGPSAVTEQLAMAVASAPTAMVVSGKFILSLPFFFHTLNGVRHLVWDTGSALSLRGTYVGGWIVNSASIVLASFFSFFY
jgi:succinate dehydrogenase (ubiquinone) cytochrome b560 subunit